jgi:hypothetical protein
VWQLQQPTKVIYLKKPVTLVDRPQMGMRGVPLTAVNPTGTPLPDLHQMVDRQ